MSVLFDIERARNETTACNEIVHFNNAGASLMPKPICEALHSYLHEEEKLGGYETQAKYAESLEDFYKYAAQLINCSTDEIAYVENATRAWGMAFYSFTFNQGDKILASIADYGSTVIAYIQQAKRYGVEIVFIPDDEHGQLDVKALANAIDDRVKLISIAHIPTGSGLVNPVNEVGRIAKAAGIPFILDACQSVGQLPIDVEEIGCDILCATGRKFLRGPRGTGFLYVRKSLIETLEPPLLDQHAAALLSPTEYQIRPNAKRFENWELYCAGKYALGKAIKYSLNWGLDNIQQRVFHLANMLRKKLATIEGITVTDEGVNKCGIVTFTSDQMQAKAIQTELSTHKINVSVSSGPGSLVSFQNRGIQAVVRASIHYYNTEKEIDYFIDILKKLLK